LTSTNTKGVITYVNKQFIKLSGYSKEELLGKTHSIIKHPETLESVYYEMWRTIQSKQVWSGMIKGLRKDQTTFINNIFITPILDKDENIVEYLTTRTDITSLVESKEKLEKSFVTDKLTNLPNRNQLLSDIKVIDHEESANLALHNAKKIIKILLSTPKNSILNRKFRIILKK
jgi:PAS domain S-box-containing protein